MKNTKEVILNKVGLDASGSYTTTALIVAFLIALVIFIVWVLNAVSGFASIYSFVKSENYVALLPFVEPKSLGGPDHTPFGENFLHTEGDYICDGKHWKNVGKMAIATYATSTETGDVFQFDFIPTGLKVANVQFGRRKTYEISFGANSYEHLFAQNLQDNSIIGFVDKDGEAVKGRFNMGFSLSSTTGNTVRIEEEVVSENSLKLKIIVQNKTFVTEEFQVTNHKKYNVVYFGLLDDSESSNQTGMIAPELRICS